MKCPDFALATYPWVPDAGDGTYNNPVIHADYSDPDVIRVGDDYYLVSSSFNCTPGLPILHSRDLVNWEIINHAVKNLPYEHYSEVRRGSGIWAPSIRYHGGKFWIFFPMPDEGTYATCAEDPAGKWSAPWCLREAKGWIDPCPFWDDDGQAYLVHAYANSRAGIKEKIHMRPMAPDCSRLLGEGKIIIDTPHHPYLEGPKMDKWNGWYYIMAPGGGVPQGWQVAFRSREVWGPYEEKIVLERGSTRINGPHQGAFVDTRDGRWWFLHFQDAGAFGRVMHMQPVTWEEGWPVIGVDYDGNGVGEPVPRWEKPFATIETPKAPATSDEFEAAILGLQWQWHANHDDSWASQTERPGWLRLRTRPHDSLELSLAPHYIGQKYPARGFVTETLLDFSGAQQDESAGLVIVGGNGSAGVCLLRESGDYSIVYIAAGEMKKISATDRSTLKIRVNVGVDAQCSFAYSTSDDAWVTLPDHPAVGEGGWVGAKVGLISFTNVFGAPAGHADFDYFRFAPPLD